MARRKQVEPDRLIAAAEVVLGVARSLGAGGWQRLPSLLSGPARPQILHEFSDDEILEACAFLRRLGVIAAT